MCRLWTFLLLVTHLSFLSAEPLSTHLYTLPFEADSALQRIIKTIDSSHNRIDAAIYSFTHKTIAKHLAKAAKRGVKIRIIFDKSANLHNRKSQLGYLAKYRNIETLVLEGKPYRKNRSEKALMHMKVMIVDNRRVVMGSANWTYSGFGKNYEVLCFIDDYGMAKQLERAFERMVKRTEVY
ncbi:phospholipase D-like domain-containing protein [Hydrogenimonas sp.]|uniref:phospholipase D-like domain-containing protein n=1 Tax=Hydrogenimonas sp. TaxID=2231112 RepID=UPI00262045EC|nr:phospholipase D-like domain-containing protein [Hydrogenimonas sp.]